MRFHTQAHATFFGRNNLECSIHLKRTLFIQLYRLTFAALLLRSHFSINNSSHDMNPEGAKLYAYLRFSTVAFHWNWSCHEHLQWESQRLKIKHAGSSMSVWQEKFSSNNSYQRQVRGKTSKITSAEVSFLLPFSETQTHSIRISSKQSSM